MKRIFLLALLLVGCGGPKSDLVTSWGTHFVFDTAKTTAIHQQYRDCMQRAIDTDYYGLDRTRSEIQDCDKAYWSKIHISDNPPTFYSVTRKQSDPDPFEEFSLCAQHLANGMWDFGPDDTTYTFRSQVRDCLNQYPNVHRQPTADGTQLLHPGDPLTALIQDGEEMLLTCSWNPTATGYAEDATCVRAK